MRSTLAVIVALNLLAFSALAGYDQNNRNRYQPPQTGFPSSFANSNQDSSDQKLGEAVMSHRHVEFIEAHAMKVVRILPDDTQGSPHQKFVVQLSNQTTVTIISNLDMCPHIPVQVNDIVGAGGEYIPTGGNSGILHWTHKDPRKTRPDGYIEFKGQVFCK